MSKVFYPPYIPYKKYLPQANPRVSLAVIKNPQFIIPALQDLRTHEPTSISRDTSAFMTSHLVATEVEILDDGKGIHYFLDSEQLADFVINCAKDYSTQLLNVLPDYGIIHTLRKDCPSVLFKIIDIGDSEKIVMVGGGYRPERKGMDLWFSLPMKDGYVSDEIKTMNEPVKTMLKLLVGTCLYANCFSEAVKDGYPDFAKHPNHYKKQKCVSIITTNKVIDRDGVTPHYRTGHFRVLKSEMFTRKRWQTVFVKECFVKGEAKTVTTI